MLGRNAVALAPEQTNARTDSVNQLDIYVYLNVTREEMNKNNKFFIHRRARPHFVRLFV